MTCDCPVPGLHRGPECRSERHGLSLTSDDWCDCPCHRSTEDKLARAEREKREAEEHYEISHQERMRLDEAYHLMRKSLAATEARLAECAAYLGVSPDGLLRAIVDARSDHTATLVKLRDTEALLAAADKVVEEAEKLVNAGKTDGFFAARKAYRDLRAHDDEGTR